MGVAGCGKSSVGLGLSALTGLTLIEGDDHHSAASREKMAGGVPLNDADRESWLERLAHLLRAHDASVVMTCSALRRIYRDQLRAASPGLRFLFLDVTRDTALARVAQRAGHFFSACLVESQFATLEDPSREPGVLRVDGSLPLPDILGRAVGWLDGVPAATALHIGDFR
jgi:gluconokinase